MSVVVIFNYRGSDLGKQKWAHILEDICGATDLITDWLWTHELFPVHVCHVSRIFLDNLSFGLGLDTKSYLTAQVIWLDKPRLQLCFQDVLQVLVSHFFFVIIV